MRHHLHNSLMFFRLLAYSMALTAAANAQSASAIHGTVKDHAGLPIPGAVVTAILEERGTNRSLTTDTEGNYQLALKLYF